MRFVNLSGKLLGLISKARLRSCVDLVMDYWRFTVISETFAMINQFFDLNYFLSMILRLFLCNFN